MVFIKKTHKKSSNSSSSSSSKSIKPKTVSRKTFNSLEYPYYKNQITKTRLLNDFNLLKQYQPSYLKYNPINKKLNKFQNRLVIFKENYNKNNDLYHITDYFSQFCRVKCLNNLKEKETPYDYFLKNKDDIYAKLMKIKEKGNLNKTENPKISYLDLSEYLYENVNQCTNFKTTVIFSILKLLKPTRFLDPSAGWGDRLIAAIAYGCSYTGVDPSNCMNKYYHEIINQLATRKEKDKNQYQIIQDGFENVIIEPESYDLVFTSPPFFDFELYENNKSQSVEKFNTLEKWLNGFLFPLIEKSYQALIVKGYFGIYISDYTGISFTSQMFKYINNSVKGFKYQGDIHFWDETNKKTVRTIFFFRKIF